MLRIGFSTEQFLDVVMVENWPLPRQLVMRHTRPLSTKGAPVQHWPAPGAHAKAAFKDADAATRATARIGVNIMGFIAVSIDWPGWWA
jgi:hypothetical protein